MFHQVLAEEEIIDIELVAVIILKYPNTRMFPRVNSVTHLVHLAMNTKCYIRNYTWSHLEAVDKDKHPTVSKQNSISNQYPRRPDWNAHALSTKPSYQIFPQGLQPTEDEETLWQKSRFQQAEDPETRLRTLPGNHDTRVPSGDGVWSRGHEVLRAVVAQLSLVLKGCK